MGLTIRHGLPDRHLAAKLADRLPQCRPMAEFPHSDYANRGGCRVILLPGKPTSTERCPRARSSDKSSADDLIPSSSTTYFYSFVDHIWLYASSDGGGPVNPASNVGAIHCYDAETTTTPCAVSEFSTNEVQSRTIEFASLSNNDAPNVCRFSLVPTSRVTIRIEFT